MPVSGKQINKFIEAVSRGLVVRMVPDLRVKHVNYGKKRSRKKKYCQRYFSYTWHSPLPGNVYLQKKGEILLSESAYNQLKQSGQLT